MTAYRINSFQVSSHNIKLLTIATITRPNGGGTSRGKAIHFSAKLFIGTNSMTLPITTYPDLSGFAPQLSFTSDCGANNTHFDFVGSFSLPQVTRKTDIGLHHHSHGQDQESDSDLCICIVSGAKKPVLELEKAADGGFVLTWQNIQDTTLSPSSRGPYCANRTEV